ncbi:MAG TPA: hypothetical protein VF005_01870, partial [Acidimicrobiales bacterium]
MTVATSVAIARAGAGVAADGVGNARLHGDGAGLTGVIGDEHEGGLGLLSIAVRWDLGGMGRLPRRPRSRSGMARLDA